MSLDGETRNARRNLVGKPDFRVRDGGEVVTMGDGRIYPQDSIGLKVFVSIGLG